MMHIHLEWVFKLKPERLKDLSTIFAPSPSPPSSVHQSFSSKRMLIRHKTDYWIKVKKDQWISKGVVVYSWAAVNNNTQTCINLMSSVVSNNYTNDFVHSTSNTSALRHHGINKMWRVGLVSVCCLSVSLYKRGVFSWRRISKASWRKKLRIYGIMTVKIETERKTHWNFLIWNSIKASAQAMFTFLHLICFHFSCSVQFTHSRECASQNSYPAKCPLTDMVNIILYWLNTVSFFFLSFSSSSSYFFFLVVPTQYSHRRTMVFVS